jgi:molybdate transport system permease protein
MAAFAAVDRTLLDASRTLGVSEARSLARVMIPAAMPGLVAGGALALGRALGEFGATLMFAGNLTGRTQTLPLTIYTALESDLQTAQSLSIILVAVAFALLVAIRAGGRR